MRHDINQLTQILKPKILVESFIEIGSRDGHDANYITQFWNIPSNKCYIIEAHPDCYKYITMYYPQFNTLNIAASDTTGVVNFNAGILGQEENIGMSSLFARNTDSFISQQISVDAWRMDEVMDYLKIDKLDLAKIDVEGASLQVLKGFSNKLSNFKAIQIELEIQEVWKDQSQYQEVVNYMESMGFLILDDVQLDEYQKDVLFINKVYA